jgi:hypothetical protein
LCHQVPRFNPVYRPAATATAKGHVKVPCHPVKDGPLFLYKPLQITTPIPYLKFPRCRFLTEEAFAMSKISGIVEQIGTLGYCLVVAQLPLEKLTNPGSMVPPGH